MKVQDLSQFRLPEGFRGRGAFTCQIWWIVQDTLFRFSPQFAYGFRRWLLRLFGAKIGKEVLIRPTARIQFPWKIKIGDRSWIGDYAHLYSLGEIEIGEDAVVSQMCYLCAASHDSRRPDFSIYASPIRVHDQAWLGADVFVMPGVEIGYGAVVGARSLVTQSVAPYRIAVGHPARDVGDRRPSVDAS